MKSGPAAGSFVYLLVDNGEIVYVGQTRNLRRRLANHGDKQFDLVSWMEGVPNDQRLLIEKRLIRQYAPKHNGNPGRPAIDDKRKLRKFRASRDEWDAYCRAAARAQTGTSTWVRDTCNEAAGIE